MTRVVLPWFLLAVFGTAAVAAPVRRAAPVTDRERLLQLLPLAGGGLAYAALGLGLKDALTPDHCRWCGRNRFDTAARDALVWDDVAAAERWSNITGYGVVPVLTLGVLLGSTATDPDARRWFDDAIPVAQAAVAAGVLNQAVKLIAVRRRPYLLVDGSSKPPVGTPNTSFFSGHAGIAFAVATSGAMVASLRGYRAAPALWVGGLALASVTGYLRVASDAHHATDVLAGAAAGFGLGVAVPWLHRRGLAPAIGRSDAAGGGTLGVAGAF